MSILRRILTPDYQAQSFFNSLLDDLSLGLLSYGTFIIQADDDFGY